MIWVNCGNCGRSSDLNTLVVKKSKKKFCGATQYQRKCPHCGVALETTVPEDETAQDKRIDPGTLPAGVLSEMARNRLDVKAGKAAHTQAVKEAAALAKIAK